MKNLTSKVVLLTGASGGIGLFIARALAKEQAIVVSVSRSKEGLERVSAEVELAGGKGISIPFDISKLEELPTLMDQIHQLAGSIDILINNAAIEKYRPLQNYSLEDTQSILTTNLMAPIELTRLVLPSMIEKNSGHIVNISSLAGKKGAPYNSIYSASKAGLIMWSDALRQELANTNIKVSVVCPGYTAAGMFMELGISPSTAGRVAEPTEVANAVLQSIKQNQEEVLLDGLGSRLLYAMTQISPQFGDKAFQMLGVVERNQSCAEKQMHPGNGV